MATPATPSFLKPTSEESANTPAANRPEKNSPKKNAPVNRGALRWILPAAGILVLLAGIAGGIYFLRHRGRGASAGRFRVASRNSSATEQKKNSSPRMAIDLALEPFVVNLADTGDRSYARIGLTLHLAVSVAAKNGGASAENNAMTGDLRDLVRDRIIDVLNRQQSADLLAPDGKERLKQAIEAAIAAKNPQIQVTDIYFTEFLVQS